jgi:AhpD family alkylhydroperoxidase
MSTTTNTLQPRMKNPAMVISETMPAIQALAGAVMKSGQKAGIDETLGLVHLRASQINGCSVCVDGAYDHVNQTDETGQRRIFAVAAWRDAPYFTDAERAALALTEAVTRLSDRSDPVPDQIWAEAARHYDEHQLAAIVLHVAITNMFNRLNASTRQPAGPQEWQDWEPSN